MLALRLVLAALSLIAAASAAYSHLQSLWRTEIAGMAPARNSKRPAASAAFVAKRPAKAGTNLVAPRLARGLLGTGPPDPTLESASPPLLRGRFGIDSTSIRHRFPDLTLFRCQIDFEEGRARRIRGWGPGGLCLVNPSQPWTPELRRLRLLPPYLR